jgi:hypothetical protein
MGALNLIYEVELLLDQRSAGQRFRGDRLMLRRRQRLLEDVLPIDRAHARSFRRDDGLLSRNLAGEQFGRLQCESPLLIKSSPITKWMHSR